MARGGIKQRDLCLPRTEPLNTAMGVFLPSLSHRSAMMPPIMVLKTLPPTPTINRQASMPARLVTKPHASWNTTNTTPEMEKTGYRPLISLNGARTMGARANPTQKVVIPLMTAVRDA